MHEEIAIGGSGGQGVLFIGRLLAEAGMREGHEVLWLPWYGAAKRGGTVWCNVTISDEKIGEMFVNRPSAAIAMNSAALVKLSTMMKSGSILIVNQSLVKEQVTREDIHTVYVPVSDIAIELGDESVGNLVALGALIASRTIVGISSIAAVMDTLLPGNQKLEMNKKALNRGYAQFSRV